MPLFQSTLLWSSIIVAGIVSPCFAASEPARLGEPGKCGRDCIYYVCQRFGQQVSLDEIDRRLNYQVDISFADMRKVFEERGFFCQSLMFDARNIGRLQHTFDKYGRSIFAIAAMPTSSEKDHHFIVVTKCTGSRLTVFDVSNNRTGMVNIADYRGKPIAVPVLLVSTKPIRYQSFSGLDILSGIAVIIIVFSFGYYCIARRWGVSLYQGASKAVRYCFRRLTFRWLSIVCGVVIVIVLLIIVCREYHYHNHPLEFAKQVIDLGEIELFSKNDVFIEVRNRSFRNVSIEEVQVSCSCLTIEEYPEIIAPKSVQVIKLQLVPLLEGNVSYQALIVPQSFAPIVGGISYSGYQQVRLLPKYLNIGIVEKGGKKTFLCEYSVENLREEFLAIETITMHGEEPILEIAGIIPDVLRNKETFTITIKHLGNAPPGSFLQSFEIRGRGNSGNEIVLLSNILGLIVE